MQVRLGQVRLNMVQNLHSPGEIMKLISNFVLKYGGEKNQRCPVQKNNIKFRSQKKMLGTVSRYYSRSYSNVFSPSLYIIIPSLPHNNRRHVYPFQRLASVVSLRSANSSCRYRRRGVAQFCDRNTTLRLNRISRDEKLFFFFFFFFIYMLATRRIQIHTVAGIGSNLLVSLLL